MQNHALEILYSKPKNSMKSNRCYKLAYFTVECVQKVRAVLTFNFSFYLARTKSTMTFPKLHVCSPFVLFRGNNAWCKKKKRLEKDIILRFYPVIFLNVFVLFRQHDMKLRISIITIQVTVCGICLTCKTKKKNH